MTKTFYFYPLFKWMVMSRNCVWFIIFLLVFQHCKIERETPEPLVSVYQPLQVGIFWVYEAEERVYFGEGDVEENRYFVRDRVVSQYFNEVGEQVFIINREVSSNRLEWQNEMAFTYIFSRGRLIKNVLNHISIPLVYPPSIQLRWDGNVKNSLDPEWFTIVHMGNYTMASRTFEAVVKVVQSEDDDQITIRDNRFEVYALHIGMVESYYEVLNYCSRSECLGEQIIQSGRFIHLKLLTHGAE